MPRAQKCSQTFEQALCRLYLDDVISYDEALQTADSPTNLSWLINHYTEQRNDDGSGQPKSTQVQAPAVKFSQFELSGDMGRGRS